MSNGKNYMQVDDTSKRTMRCYFERYQDKSYEKTRQRISSLMMQNKKDRYVSYEKYILEVILKYRR